MHALQAIAVVAVLVIGLGAKLAFFPAAEAVTNKDVVQSASVNFVQINFDQQNDNSLPVEKIHDMTFVDPNKD